jgi:hypothetical protein
MGDYQRREFPEALLDADSFEDPPGKWQAAIMKAEENRPNLRIVGDAWFEKLLPAPRSLCWNGGGPRERLAACERLNAY